jgi:hypothetical protein
MLEEVALSAAQGEDRLREAYRVAKSLSLFDSSKNGPLQKYRFAGKHPLLPSSTGLLFCVLDWRV